MYFYPITCSSIHCSWAIHWSCVLTKTTLTCRVYETLKKPSKLQSHENATLLFLAFHSTAVTLLVDLVVKDRASLQSYFTMSQLVNGCGCGSGSDLTQWARQQVGDWFFIQVSVVERSPEPCGISGSAEPTGQGCSGCSRGPPEQGRAASRWSWMLVDSSC